MTFYLSIALGLVRGSAVFIDPQQSAHFEDEIAPKVLPLIGVQDVRCPKLEYPVLDYLPGHLCRIRGYKWDGNCILRE